jgi:hypothetical protein
MVKEGELESFLLPAGRWLAGRSFSEAWCSLGLKQTRNFQPANFGMNLEHGTWNLRTELVNLEPANLEPVNLRTGTI